MNLANKTVVLLLTEEGDRLLKEFGVGSREAGVFIVEVRESEDLGLWLKAVRSGKAHFVLLRWEYILLIDLPGDAPGPIFGMKS